MTTLCFLAFEHDRAQRAAPGMRIDSQLLWRMAQAKLHGSDPLLRAVSANAAHVAVDGLCDTLA